MQGEKTALLMSDLLLLLTALVWGFGFVAQRAGMEYMGPLTYNGIRFLLGGMALLPLALFRQRHGISLSSAFLVRIGVPAGCALFAGATLQQVGLQFTTAGRAGFITGLYVLFVPILGLALGRRTSPYTWSGAVLAVCGLYLLCVRSDLTLGGGDLLVLLGAVFWAVHVLILDRQDSRNDPVSLAVFQFLFCGLVSLAWALAVETVSPAGIRQGLLPILYGGLVSVGIGYTLQVVAQRRAHPAHAVILLSLEAVFAVLGGWWLLAEAVTARGLTGCVLMLAGMILSQMSPRDHGPEAGRSPGKV